MHGIIIIYRIRSIRRRSYYLFHCLSLCGVDSRAVTIREQHVLTPVATREAILIEKRSIDTTELGDSGAFADVEKG